MRPPESPPPPSSDHSLRVAWGLLVALLIVLPSITSGERITFEVGGLELNLRFVAYASSAGVMAVLAALLAAQRLSGFVRDHLVAMMFLGWVAVTIAVAGQQAREWLPPLLRWVLFLGAFTVGHEVSRSSLGAGARRQARFAVAAGLVLPLVVGLVELISGTAPILNNAPRISGTASGHPVAFSLLLMVGGFVLLPIALTAGSRGTAFAAAVVITAAVAELMFTYTRLTLALALVGGVVLVVSLHPRARLRSGAVASGVALVVLTVAAPMLISRFEQPTAWPPPSTPGPSVSTQPTPAPVPTPTPRLVLIDNSTKLRIDTHRRGLGYIAESPLLGHGLGSFDRLYERDTGNDEVAAHDDLLLYAVEAGAPGLVLLLALYARVLFPLVPRVIDGRADGGFGASALVAFGLLNVVGVIHNPTYFPEVQITAWAVAGLAVGNAPQEGWWPERIKVLVARRWPLRPLRVRHRPG